MCTAYLLGKGKYVLAAYSMRTAYLLPTGRGLGVHLTCNGGKKSESVQLNCLLHRGRNLARIYYMLICSKEKELDILTWFTSGLCASGRE